ncbi:MAG: phage virion morphogenesis protein [Rhodocyclaceae bacterium]|jgi:phage virion morphogenesis protein|nr:phage virion morphogenesis protein [Rhodocyclaceae bacterium]MBK6555387.1 phage virion morphogenesis protein [Rhodocyclaceae bacterium]MBK6676705.1 phage virion morphogenesis protein [Rhodocyclaceae bacterium]MBK9309330.1 phage virion morphogenesis protein [Rhodocyclaceae bacterium]MBK9955576.1 phage virion morphogenesis protein [Rhodocyclaceae bacterium]
MTAFRIEVTDGPVIDALNQLAAQAADPTPAMRAIAGLLERQAEDNFAAESGPLGKWPALKNPGERRKGGKILQDTGRLAASLHSWATADEAGVGVSAIYAAIHQLGGQTKPHVILPRNKKALAFGGHVVKKVNHPGSLIPARPFLPVTPYGRLQDGLEEEVLDAIQAHLLGAA